MKRNAFFLIGDEKVCQEVDFILMRGGPMHKYKMKASKRPERKSFYLLLLNEAVEKPSRQEDILFYVELIVLAMAYEHLLWNKLLLRLSYLSLQTQLYTHQFFNRRTFSKVCAFYSKTRNCFF